MPTSATAEAKTRLRTRSRWPARRARSIVLLKNESSCLPLDARRSGAWPCIGTHARDTPIGGYSDVPRHVVSVLEGLQDAAQGQFAVDYAEGVRLTESRCWSCDEVKLVPTAVNRKLIAEAVADRAQGRRRRHGARRQ